MKRQLFSGSAVLLATPLGPDGAPDYDAVSRLIEHQLDAGTDAIIAGGGYALGLPRELRLNLIEHTVTMVNTRVPVLGMIPGGEHADAAGFSRDASVRGVDGLLLEHEGERQALDIAENVGLPVVLCAPESRPVPMEHYKTLAAHPLVLATVEAGADIGRVVRLVAEYSGALAVYAGRDDLVLPVLSLGGAGVVSTLANVAAADVREMCHLYFMGRMQDSLTLQLQHLPLAEALRCGNADTLIFEMEKEGLL